jgi:hypothetical protein
MRAKVNFILIQWGKRAQKSVKAEVERMTGIASSNAKSVTSQTINEKSGSKKEWYPCIPVVGLCTFEPAATDQTTTCSARGSGLFVDNALDEGEVCGQYQSFNSSCRRCGIVQNLGLIFDSGHFLAPCHRIHRIMMILSNNLNSIFDSTEN